MADRILIVEDEPRMRDILRDYFHAHGVEADLAADGAAGLDRFRARDYDAVLLDVMMPGLDGYGVCRAIRRESRVPILFLTPWRGNSRAGGLRAGCRRLCDQALLPSRSPGQDHSPDPPQPRHLRRHADLWGNSAGYRPHGLYSM